ncbi:hypothetical protein FB451DRAFT_1404892 [Mycena latifolia]|nr:hypothetical protein FB451DRAFT_1404892 [Mycena latifolia]
MSQRTRIPPLLFPGNNGLHPSQSRIFESILLAALWFVETGHNATDHFFSSFCIITTLQLSMNCWLNQTGSCRVTRLELKLPYEMRAWNTPPLVQFLHNARASLEHLTLSSAAEELDNIMDVLDLSSSPHTALRPPPASGPRLSGKIARAHRPQRYVLRLGEHLLRPLRPQILRSHPVDFSVDRLKTAFEKDDFLRAVEAAAAATSSSCVNP